MKYDSITDVLLKTISNFGCGEDLKAKELMY